MNIEYPEVVTYRYDSWPGVTDQEAEVQFRLVYRGRLPAQSQSNIRTEDKHRIRKLFHKQLREFWNNHPFLSERKALLVSGLTPPATHPSITGSVIVDETQDDSSKRALLDLIADNYARCGYRFVPLVNNLDGVACSLDILFLRRDEPGKLITSGGDIDNRINVLFDALRMPKECHEIGGYARSEDEDPFFCLLEDDSLITEVKVTADRLLIPLAENESRNDVHLVIHVRTIVLRGLGGSITAFLT